MARLTVIAGPNGSGKTTLTRELITATPGVHINPDDMATDKAAAEGGTFEDHVAWAATESREQRDKRIKDGKSVSYETVMSHESHLKVMTKARGSSMSVSLIYVLTREPDINVLRVANRVATGGHNVPEEKTRGRYTKSLAQLMDAAAISTSIIVFDNSGAPEEAKIVCVGRQGLLHIHDELRAVLQRHVPEYVPSSAKFFQGLSDGVWTEFALDPGILARDPSDLGRRHRLIHESLTFTPPSE